MSKPNLNKIGEVSVLISEVLEIASIKGLRFTKDKIREIKTKDIDSYVVKDILGLVLSVFAITQKELNNRHSKNPNRKDANAAAAYLIRKHTTMQQQDIAEHLRISKHTCRTHLTYINKLGDLPYELDVKEKIAIIEKTLKQSENEQ